MKQIKKEENFTSSGNGHEVKIINLNPNRHDESNGKSCLYRQVNCYVHIKTREISLTIVLSFLSANVLQNGTGHLHDICKLEMASKVCTANIK